jgi:hypothetical protein
MARSITDKAAVIGKLKAGLYLTDKCIPYWGHINSDGYGIIKIGGRNGRYYRVHRLIYEAVIGSIPDRLYVCHTCDNPACYNPNHLFPGTQKDNMEDMKRKGRQYITYGERNGNFKLSSGKIRQIRLDKRPLRLIARDYRISASTVSEIKNKKSRAYE